MNNIMVAVNDKIFVKSLRRAISKGGIILPDTAGQIDPQKFGLVLSVGEKVSEIKEGDIIMFHPRGGQSIVIDNIIYAVVMYGETYGVLKDESTITQLGEEAIGK
jgi:co-chaperonin GroES (HSP10)